MAMNRTFASRAKLIQNKYKNADRNPVERDSMMDELQRLADEQEALKEQMDMQQQGNQFSLGGFLSVLDGIDPKPLAKTLDVAKYGYKDFDLQEPILSEVKKPLPKAKVTLWDKIRYGVLDENSENYMAALSGLTQVAGNLINKNRVGDPKKIEPAMYTPSVKPTFFDSTPVEARLNQMLASSSYGIMNKSSDMGNYITALRTVANDTSEVMGQQMMEGQKLNMGEQGRIDAMVSDAGKINTEASNQAMIDWEQRKDYAAQLKRDYSAGAWENVGGIFETISNYELAKKLGPLYKQVATLEALEKERQSTQNG
jgi:hypothetical protein